MRVGLALAVAGLIAPSWIEAGRVLRKEYLALNRNFLPMWLAHAIQKNWKQFFSGRRMKA